MLWGFYAARLNGLTLVTLAS
uniref:Uncharacterized protein n=1 Tax=Anguilla anguilla TaxID=7936 RepID=A0A0E9QXR1_ANGAN